MSDRARQQAYALDRALLKTCGGRDGFRERQLASRPRASDAERGVK